MVGLLIWLVGLVCMFGWFVGLVGWFGWFDWLVGLVGWLVWLVGWLVGWFYTVGCMVYKCNRMYLEINYMTELLLVLMKYYDRNPHQQAATDVL